MNESDLLARRNPQVVCNKCKATFVPYPNSFAPQISEVVCPNCSEKRILYFGDDPTVVKMILSSIGVNKDLLDRVTELENKVIIMKERYEQGLIEAQKVMSEALLGTIKEELKEYEDKCTKALNEHESKWHPTSMNFKGKHP